MYSAASVVYKTSLNANSVGLTGPECFGFGTSVTCPSALNAGIRHGPSTIDHSGDDTYPLRFFAWSFR